jgi:hypothetical protein
MSLSGFFGDICSAFFREKGASNDPAGGICTFDCLLLFDVSQLIMTFKRVDRIFRGLGGFLGVNLRRWCGQTIGQKRIGVIYSGDAHLIRIIIL